MSKSTDPILMKLYIYALEHWNDKEEPEYPTFISKKYKTLFLQQKLIGWNQIAKTPNISGKRSISNPLFGYTVYY